MDEPRTTNATQTPSDLRTDEPRHLPRIFAHEDPAVEQLVRDELHDHSPEGDGPDSSTSLVSVGVLVIIATLTFITVVGIVAVLGGWPAALLAAGFVLVAYLFAGYPIIQAGRMRSDEETKVRRVVKGQPIEPTPKV